MLHKAARGARRVPGLPDLHIAWLQQAAPGFAPGGRAVGEQKTHAGQCLAQLLQQRRCRMGFAQRHGMNPDPGAGRRGCLQRVVTAKALLHVLGVEGFLVRALLQFAAQERLRQPQHGAVQAQRKALAPAGGLGCA